MQTFDLTGRSSRFRTLVSLVEVPLLNLLEVPVIRSKCFKILPSWGQKCFVSGTSVCRHFPKMNSAGDRPHQGMELCGMQRVLGFDLVILSGVASLFALSSLPDHCFSDTEGCWSSG